VSKARLGSGHLAVCCHDDSPQKYVKRLTEFPLTVR